MSVRNRCLHLATGRTRDDIEKRIWQRLRKGEKVGTGERERAVAKKAGVVKSEEELKDYESLKQVVLKEYEPSPKICLENFRKAKRNSDETFSQFASRLTSMWLYYCKLREANDFESVNQLIVADEMFEMLDSKTATHIGKSYDEPERAKWNDSEKRSFNGSWGKQPFGSKNKYFKRDCPKNKEVDNKRLNVNKVSTEGTELVDGTVAARVDLLGNVDETEVSSSILPEKAQEHIEDSQRNITSCRNEVGTLGTKDEEVTAEMDKGIMVADSFRSEQEGCAELALVWKHAKEDKGNYYEVDGYLFHRDKILGESIGKLVIPKCSRTEALRLAHTSVFSSHMCPKKTLERIKYSLFWEGLSSNVKKFCESCNECRLTRSVRIKDRSPITPVARSELPFQVVNMDLIGPINPPSSKGHKIYFMSG
ncbi:retrovirus-related Pol polyprotein from transposon opus [Trichonephila clavipes]|nr:retrovirus-related Pol polyprotein from transposon opus [Trichonephila clavipes]